MRPISRHAVHVIRLVAVLSLAGALASCSLFTPAESAPRAKKRWSLWPWGGKATDATQSIEYHRTRSGEKDPLYTLSARNTHRTKTIAGQMRTTMQTTPGGSKVDSQSFTLGPSEEKKLLVYPARLPLTYEVTAFFRE